MSIWITGTLLGLLWFVIVNTAVSMLVWAAVQVMDRLAAEPDAGTLLTLRVLPSVASILFVTVIFLPGHWRLEPRTIDERFGAFVCVLAFVAIAVFWRAVRRAVVVATASLRLHRLVREHQPRCGGFVEIAGYDGISLGGLFRTHVLVGDAVGRTLTPPELEAALRHELAHRRAWDNIKRTIVHCAPDLFGWSRASRMLDARWSAAVESAADARAVEGDQNRAVHLASALVKVACLSERRSTLTDAVWSTLHQRSLLHVRVRRLVDGTAVARGTSCSSASWTMFAICLVFGCGWLFGAPASIHHATEALVALLP